MIADCTLDRFLDGRIVAAQPKSGFRAGHDTVLLAAAVPAGRKVLELGSGVGIASLCYAHRVPQAEVLGIEIDPELVAIARDNAARNGFTERVKFLAGDAAALEAPAIRFDQVFFNPPFHASSGTPSPVGTRDEAKRDTGTVLAQFVAAALRNVQPGATITAIIRCDRVDDLLAAAANCSAAIFPLYPCVGIEPKRAIVQIAAGVPGPVNHAAGLVLHESGGGHTPEAEAILRGRQKIRII